ncbi:MAG TPA: PEP-CTERM sorting domain-containing protein [Tepidisphaeraceae bacterium]
MKKSVLTLAAAAGLLSLAASVPASAAIKVVVDSPTITQPTGSDLTTYVDVYFNETAPTQDEKMNTLLLSAYLTGPNVGASGVHFGAFDANAQTPASNPRAFVLGTQKLYDAGTDATHYNAGADSAPGTTGDVTDGIGLARIPLVIPAGTAPGTYQIKIDDGDPGENGFTSFGSADEATFPGAAIPFTSQDGTVTISGAVTPEPATLGLFGIAAVGFLARRRRTA